MEEEIRALLERGVQAIEKLAEDPVIHLETAPPVCPHCEKVNPVIRVGESEGTGEMAEFVIQAQCLSCNKVFYSLPLQWACAKTVGEITTVIQERAEFGGYSNARADQRT